MAGHAALLCAQACLIGGDRVLVYHSVAGAAAAAQHRATAAVLQVVATRVPMALHAACVWLGVYTTCGSCGPAACCEGICMHSQAGLFVFHRQHTLPVAVGWPLRLQAYLCTAAHGWAPRGVGYWQLWVMCDCHPACPTWFTRYLVA